LCEPREPLQRRPFIIVDERDEGCTRGGYTAITGSCKAANWLHKIREPEPILELYRNPLARAPGVVVDDDDIEKRGVLLVD
jgi:hypothetical protein